MDEFYFRRNPQYHVPAFGSWDCNDDLPFTQCFETATRGGLLRYSYSQDRDLYVAGDLYENDVVTPTMIVVPRNRGKTRFKKAEDDEKEVEWVVCDYEYGGYGLKQPPSPLCLSPSPPPSPPPPPPAPKAKPVDEDLYKISPDLLRAQQKKRKAWGLFSSCMRPCVC